MATYKVEWEIEVDANTPLLAAIECLEIQQDPFSEALAFTVTHLKTGKMTEIDLISR